MANERGYVEDPLLPGRQPSIRLIFSYVLDWIIIIIVAGVGGLLYKITGYTHAFSLEDPSISYPLVANTVSITVVGIVACGVPAVVIMVLCLLIPSSTIERSGQCDSRSVWHRRLWEWHAGWLGLGLSLAGAFFITSGLKDVVGKPRPDFLARCDPDLSNVAAYVVGGLGLKETSAPFLVNTSICQNKDLRVVKDGFAAFPSGHSSFSWAGLLYLSLWLSVKFAITFPVPFHRAPSRRQGEENVNIIPSANKTPFRSSAAAPPLYLLLLVLTPVAVALFICATRYADYMHAGWDILGGSLIGISFAYVGFRWYHVPHRGGEFPGYAGWAWAPRSTRGAFGVPFGSPSFGRYEDSIGEVRTNTSGYEDLELGPLTLTGANKLPDRYAHGLGDALAAVYNVPIESILCDQVIAYRDSISQKSTALQDYIIADRKLVGLVLTTLGPDIRRKFERRTKSASRAYEILKKHFGQTAYSYESGASGRAFLTIGNQAFRKLTDICGDGASSPKCQFSQFMSAVDRRSFRCWIPNFELT